MVRITNICITSNFNALFISGRGSVQELQRIAIQKSWTILSSETFHPAINATDTDVVPQLKRIKTKGRSLITIYTACVFDRHAAGG